jgi:hypothetical protein
MQTVTEDDVVIVEPKRKRGRPKAKPPAPIKQRDADREKRMEKARTLVVRGTPRKVIIKKLKLTAEEVTALEAWNRGRR